MKEITDGTELEVKERMEGKRERNVLYDIKSGKKGHSGAWLGGRASDKCLAWGKWHQ